MGPSIGELNKNLFWSSDYFIIPCSPDSYCKTTMKTMERTLPEWCLQQKRLYQITKHMTLPLNKEVPKFLGIIMGLFHINNQKKVLKNSQHWMDIIKNTIKNDLIPVLKKYNMVHSQCTNDYTLSEIPNFLSLMPIAQKSFSPVFDIPSDAFIIEDDNGNIKSMNKNEIKRHQDRSKYFYGKYSVLAKLIIDMLRNENYNDIDDEDSVIYDRS